MGCDMAENSQLERVSRASEHGGGDRELCSARRQVLSPAVDYGLGGAARTLSAITRCEFLYYYLS